MGDDTLKTQIREQMTDAMRSGDKIALGALRMLTAAIVNREKEIGHELSDDEVREVAGKEVKKRVESIEAFDAAGRTELADKERAERAIARAVRPRCSCRTRRPTRSSTRRSPRPEHKVPATWARSWAS